MLNLTRGLRQAAQGRGHLLRRLPHLGVGRERPARCPGLDQHALGGRGGAHIQPVQGLLGLPGLTGVIRRQVLGRKHLAADEDRRDQEKPTEHGRLAVPGTPARDPLDHRWPGAGAGRVQAGLLGRRESG
jgi:hypothetical protein